MLLVKMRYLFEVDDLVLFYSDTLLEISGNNLSKSIYTIGPIQGLIISGQKKLDLAYCPENIDLDAKCNPKKNHSL